MRVGCVAAVVAVVAAVVAVAPLLLLLPKMNGIQWRRQRPVFFTFQPFVGRDDLPTVHTHTHWRNQKKRSHIFPKRQIDASSKEAKALENCSNRLGHTT